MTADQKRTLLHAVAASPLGVRETLRRLDLCRTTYYRWRQRYAQQGRAGLVDTPPHGPVWNQLLPEEREQIRKRWTPLFGQVGGLFQVESGVRGYAANSVGVGSGPRAGPGPFVTPR